MVRVVELTGPQSITSNHPPYYTLNPPVDLFSEDPSKPQVGDHCLENIQPQQIARATPWSSLKTFAFQFEGMASGEGLGFRF